MSSYTHHERGAKHVAAKKSTPPTKGQATRTKNTGKAAKLPRAVVKAAKEQGLLPHEVLLKVSRGEKFKIKVKKTFFYKTGEKKGEIRKVEWVEEDYYPTFNEMMDCAKSAAPYFAPRLASQTIGADSNTTSALANVMKELSTKLPG